MQTKASKWIFHTDSNLDGIRVIRIGILYHALLEILEHAILDDGPDAAIDDIETKREEVSPRRSSRSQTGNLAAFNRAADKVEENVADDGTDGQGQKRNMA
jgi:hypothetical protein